MAKKRCKKCGRQYEAGGESSDGYCSALCRMAGYFIGGGGDTAKPGAAARPPEAEEKPPSAAVRPTRVRKDDARFARVRLMFTLPPGERWELARGFSEEERAFARRLARREEMEAARFAREWDWDGADGGADGETEEPAPSGDIGDSDDGSV